MHPSLPLPYFKPDTCSFCPAGLATDDVKQREIQYGPNRLREAKPKSILSIVLLSILQPFNALMAAVAILTISPPNSDPKTFSILMVCSVLFLFIDCFFFLVDIPTIYATDRMIVYDVSHVVCCRHMFLRTWHPRRL